ncbi:hypothetical protein TWF694_005846 [Orbilia ellipsospora]|uniref:N-acetyltransferase domain-containing protein n=1 Tax=Orbilia ellipsospora TaxID=2528407 RepID=A0AAV9WT74_9PEZI
MTSTIPPGSRYPLEITTPRLTIRSASTSDAPQLYNFFTTPENLPTGESPEPNISIPEFERRISRWREMAEQGKNAFIVVTLKSDSTEDKEGLIGFGGYNTFEKLLEGEGEAVLTDIGTMIDVKHQRKGYALEAFCALVEHAFEGLGVGKIRVETGLENLGFRRFMVDGVGLRDVEVVREVSYRKGVEGYVYTFGRETWKKAKEGLKARQRWLL